MTATFKFPSPEWTAAYEKAINDNAAYKTAGKDWTHGAVAFVVNADAAIGVKEEALILDVNGGVCRKATHCTRAEAESGAPFVVVGDYARWKEVLTGKEDPIKAMMQNKLKLTKGHLPTIIRYVESSRQLVKSAMAVPTEFVA